MQAIALCQAQGRARPTNNEVHDRVGGHRGDVTRYMKQWRQAQDQPLLEAPAVPVAPASPPSLRWHSRALRDLCAQLDEDWRVMERAVQQLQQQRAQAHADLRNGIRDASRLTRRLRQAEAQARSPVSLMQPDAVQQRAQLRAELTQLVGEAEVTQVLADVQYTPWWLEG